MSDSVIITLIICITFCITLVGLAWIGSDEWGADYDFK
jgi:hypothetical protein|nr:MAG TPA: hypothetical protein [Caudoviricetes sp.]